MMTAAFAVRLNIKGHLLLLFFSDYLNLYFLLDKSFSKFNTNIDSI